MINGVCPECGAAANTGANFCARCGAKLAQSKSSEQLFFKSIDEANSFLRGQGSIARLETNFVQVSEIGLLSGRSRLERVELRIEYGELGGEIYQLAQSDQIISPFLGYENISQELRERNPGKRIVSVQTSAYSGGRVLAGISGAGGIRHLMIFVTYACKNGCLSPFVF